jgi:hypothetical protein
MQGSGLTHIKKLLNTDHNNPTFKAVEAGRLPKLGAIPYGKATRLSNLGHGFYNLRGSTSWNEQQPHKTVSKGFKHHLAHAGSQSDLRALIPQVRPA